MGEKNKFIRNIMIGAVAGAVVSVFHKPTRDAVIQETKYVTTKVNEFVKDPGILTNQIRSKVEDVMLTVEQAKEDALFINEKITELKETTPQVMGILRETKEQLFQMK